MTSVTGNSIDKGCVAFCACNRARVDSAARYLEVMSWSLGIVSKEEMMAKGCFLPVIRYSCRRVVWSDSRCCCCVFVCRVLLVSWIVLERHVA